MNYDNGAPISALLNTKEFIGTTEVTWSEGGRIQVWFDGDRTQAKPRPSEVYDYSKTALKGVLDNLRASDGKTTKTQYLGNGFKIIFNIKFAERRKDLFNFDFVDGKIVQGTSYECREYSAGKTYAKTAEAYVKNLPSFLEVDGTYRVHSDGRLEKIRDRTFENMKRFEFPAITVIAQQSTKKRVKNGSNSIPDYAEAA